MIGSTTISHTLCIICSVFNAYSAVLFLPNQNGNGFYLADFFSLGDKFLINRGSAPNPGLVCGLLNCKQATCLPNYVDKKQKLGYYRNEDTMGIKAFMASPLADGGILCVDSKNQYSFSADKDLKMLHLFADLISGLEQNKPQSYSNRIPEYFVAMSIIQNMAAKHPMWTQFILTFLQTISRTTGLEYCAFVSYDGQGDYYRIECETHRVVLENNRPIDIHLSHGIAGLAIQNHEAVFLRLDSASPTILFGAIPDMPDFQIAICLPVDINRNTRCVLCFGNTALIEIDETMRTFLQQTSSFLAMYLENLYLQDRLRNMLPKTNLNLNQKSSLG